MNEETKTTECQHECFCKKRFKDILVIAIGSFVGVYCALNLFCALHKPPFPPYPMMMNPHGAMYAHPGAFKHHHHFGVPGKFKGDFKAQKPVENEENRE